MTGNINDINEASALGKGEAVSSILTGSTIKTPTNPGFSRGFCYDASGINKQNGARTYPWSPWKIRGMESRFVPGVLRER